MSGSSKRKFTHQSYIQHISLKSWWKLMPQSSEYSWIQDLQHAYPNCMNCEIRNLTFKRLQNWIRDFQALRSKNRWSSMLVWWFGWMLDAQSCLILLKSTVAIDDASFNSSRISSKSLQSCFNPTQLWL